MALPWLKAPLGRWGDSGRVGAPAPTRKPQAGRFRAATWCRPYKRSEICPLIRLAWRPATFPPGGRSRRRRIRTAAVSSANPGAQMEPHQRQFLQGQGPVAREESRRPFPFFAPEILLNFSGVRPP